jgi:beta-glucosidase
MKKCITRMLQGLVLGAGSVSLFMTAQPAAAQTAATLPYLDTSLTPEQRAADLVHRMSLAEKATQMQNNSAAVTRLNVPAYQWWSEALHGVINDGVTEYPEPIGLAATFDAPGIHTMAAQIGIEGRIKHVQNLREGHTGIMGGLDFWSPNLNIFRDPRWGRGQETYGEDPFLTVQSITWPLRHRSTMPYTAGRSRRATLPMWM